jgi:hypothetical protein
VPLACYRVGAHERCQGEIDQENPKADGEEQQGLVFLRNRQIHEQQPYRPHDQMPPFQAEYAGLKGDAVQNIEKFLC